MMLRMVAPEEIVFHENKFTILFMIGVALMLWAVYPLDREDNL